VLAAKVPAEIVANVVVAMVDQRKRSLLTQNALYSLTAYQRL
jgi:hypothetical protein